MIKILNEYPPNIEEIRKRFVLHSGIIFTYRDTIYNPDNGVIDKPLLVHEQTHSKQQGDNPKDWWRRYLLDNDFRFVQELEAYQNQFKEFCKTNKDRNKQNLFLFRIGNDLSSEIYGNMCSLNEAMRVIKNKIKFKI